MSAPFDADALGALYDRARRLEDAGDIEGAATLFRACLEMDPDDHCGVVMRLAGHGLALPQTAPPAYVATLFEQHAEVFDEILVGRLGYDVPALARRLVGAHREGPLRILDLGCGTGLVGVAFADIASEIIGVDAAEGMLALSDERDVYSDLYVGEAVAFMAEWDEAPFDLVCRHVWPYLGDLAPFAAAAAFACAPRQPGRLQRARYGRLRGDRHPALLPRHPLRGPHPDGGGVHHRRHGAHHRAPRGGRAGRRRSPPRQPLVTTPPPPEPTGATPPPANATPTRLDHRARLRLILDGGTRSSAAWWRSPSSC